MHYQVLARKWRPKKFQEVLGQAHIVRSLQNAITSDKLGHAYILAGTRGIGKTTVARLFAKAIRCEARLSDGNPCEKCLSCEDIATSNPMNVIEIDGASNNSVENIRELVSNVQFVPTSGKYKIYIIDEVHMLSTSAFNALLKTLEEPPTHVIFIFATTEPDKLLGTVLSRCQRFDFRNMGLADLAKLIKEIAAKENIVFENDELINQLCKRGRGSARDTLSLLDQVLSYSSDRKISEDTMVVSLGIARTSLLGQLISSMLTGEAQKMSENYRTLLNENVATREIVTSILELLHQIIESIDNQAALYRRKVLTDGSLKGVLTSELFWIYETLAKDSVWVLESIMPEKVLEIMLQKLCLRRTFFKEVPLEEKVTEQVTVAIPQKETPKETAGIFDWEKFIKFLYGKSPALASNLEQGNILIPINGAGGVLTVSLGFNHAAKVFFEYLTEKSVQEKLKKFLSEHFNIPEANVNLKLVLLDEEKRRETNFQSRVEIEKGREEVVIGEMRNAILNNPMLKEAEGLFNAKVDKVIVDHNAIKK